MPTPVQKKELVKLRVLTHLSEPAAIEFGATGTDIYRDVDGERGVTMDVLLADMVREGLIERRTEDGKQAKPYFITESGRQYLDQQSTKAIFPEVSKKENWAIAASAGSLHEVFAETLRSLPEFRRADDDRIQEVGRLLASRAKGKPKEV
jgi:DNA-binding PadR family transcriptional regulator